MIKLNNLKVTRSAALAIAVAASTTMIAGCGSSSSSKNIRIDHQAEGVVYDGYLDGANVCLDLNRNGVCDAGEPSAMSTAGGRFLIDAETAEQLDAPFAMETNENTIDEDDGLPIGAGLRFRAPAGSTAISAFSTVVQIQAERLTVEQGLTASEAVAQASSNLNASLGLPAGTDLLNFDPIAAKDVENADETARDLGARLHLVNQVVSQQLLAAADQLTDQATFNAFANKFDYAAILAAVDESLEGLAPGSPERASASPADVVISAPALPTAEEVAAEQEIIDRQTDPAPSPGTGGTGGTGGGGTL